LQRTGEDRQNAWTLGGIAIDQVSRGHKVPGRSVPGRRIMAGTRAKALADASSQVTGATAVMQQSADKGQAAHGSDLHRGHVWRGSVDTTRRSKTRCQRS
jgi:hypothetical protein